MVLFSIVSFFILNSAHSQQILDRQEMHESAAQEFLNTHFFEQGRGMTISPDLTVFLGDLKSPPSGLKDSIIIKRYGFLPGEKNTFVGVFKENYKNMELAILGCTGCHSGRAAGVLVPGLGNKTIDPFRIGQDLIKAQNFFGSSIATKAAESDDYAYIHNKATIFARTLADEHISNLTMGLVPDSAIKTFFYRDTNTAYGPEIQRTQVKAPSLWGFAEKRKVGVFADGSLNSDNYAWAFGAELMASDSGDHMRAVMPKLIHFVDNVIANLLPPPYPFKIDTQLAEVGRPLVEKNCFGCHGKHNRDPEGFPIFEAPQLIPQDLVGTDPQRLDYGNSLWVDLAEQGSVRDLIKFNRAFFNYGYYAPKLWGIWSRFPYLHNGSVPTLYHMLIKPEERPVVFLVEDAGELYRYDKTYAGLTTFRNPAEIAAETWNAENGDRELYYIHRPEHSNQGHYFEFMNQLSYEDRMAIVEYLKTL